MIIDFHTHIFPDKVAAKALPKLSSIIQLAPSMNGTIDGIKASMEDGGVDVSLVLPIVTEPRQFDSILRFAAYINETQSEGPGPRLISFASIHPEEDGYREQLRQICREGFRGIKLHPNYQNTFFDDIRYMRIIDAASELGLCVLTHAGADPYTPGQDFCSPDMILHVLKEVAPPRLIAAHMGSNENYALSEEKLCGQKLYFDTAYSLVHMPPEQFVRMAHSHGTDRLLFGTDAPWASQKECVNALLNMSGLSEKEKQQILYENAAFLLGI